MTLLIGASLAGCSTLESGAADETMSEGVGPLATSDAGPGNAGDGAPQIALAERLFREIEPELVAKCGGICHQEGLTETAPPWLKAPAYDTIRTYPGIVINDVYSSKLLVKPNHLGISLQDKSLVGLRDKVVSWLTAEAEAKNAAAVQETDPFPVVPGPNGIDLSRAGKDITGARITFDATLHTVEQNQILQLQNVKIQAPATTPLKVVHPVLVIVPEGDALPEKDPLDQFSTVDQTVGAGQTDSLGPGSAMLVRFPVKAQLKIRFEKLGTPAALNAGRQCKSVAAFTQNAVPAIQQNGCLTCHGGGNRAAVNAVDMTKIGTDDAAACVQVLNKVNLADRAKSPLILAPTSGNASNHSGGKNLDPAGDYVTKMMAWIQAE